MISFEEALALTLEAVPPPRKTRTSLHGALGMVLAAPIRADMDLPPFDKSCMDGYALSSSDAGRVPVTLRVAGTQGAGAPAPFRVLSGQALRIMTGAPLPPGADAVQMVEKTRSPTPDQVLILDTVQPGQNVAARGSEVVASQTVLGAGTRLEGRHIAVLAAFGRTRVPVFAPPAVRVMATGDELVSPGLKPGPGQIRNSNAAMLAAQCRRMGVPAGVGPIVRDDPLAVSRALHHRKADVLLLSGGVSAGEYDYVHRCLAEAGFAIRFHKVALKPGKPVLVAVRSGQMLFGLPGNPVSACVTFELLVRPALMKWMGKGSRGLPRVDAVLESEIRQKPGRLWFKPARTRMREGELSSRPLQTRGSADIVGFAAADSLIRVEADKTRLRPGQRVEVVLLPGHPLAGT